MRNMAQRKCILFHIRCGGVGEGGEGGVMWLQTGK